VKLAHFFVTVVWLLCSYEVLLLLDREKTPEGPWLYYTLNTLLISLLVLHIYWWILIYRMIVRQVEARGKMSHDVRSGILLATFLFLQYVDKRGSV
jgi:ceramide synthetase